MEPVATLLKRLRAELSHDFARGKQIRVSRAPGRLDVMGGIADYTGSLVCEATLDRAAAVAVQGRDDRQVQVFSFNLFDDHQAFTFRIPLEAWRRRRSKRCAQNWDSRGGGGRVISSGAWRFCISASFWI